MMHKHAWEPRLHKKTKAQIKSKRNSCHTKSMIEYGLNWFELMLRLNKLKLELDLIIRYMKNKRFDLSWHLADMTSAGYQVTNLSQSVGLNRLEWSEVSIHQKWWCHQKKNVNKYGYHFPIKFITNMATKMK